jgi:hypothetical protein
VRAGRQETPGLRALSALNPGTAAHLIRKTSVVQREDHAGIAWFARVTVGRNEACRWSRGANSAAVPAAAACRSGLRQHMPEFPPYDDSACGLVGGGDVSLDRVADRIELSAASGRRMIA